MCVYNQQHGEQTQRLVVYPSALREASFQVEFSVIQGRLVRRQDIGVSLDPASRSSAANHAIIIDPAPYPKLRARSDLFHSYYQSATSQVNQIIGTLGPMRGYGDIAVDLLAWSNWLIQKTIETVLVDVYSCRTDWVPGTVECQV
jgi:hypothetical protein